MIFIVDVFFPKFEAFMIYLYASHLSSKVCSRKKRQIEHGILAKEIIRECHILTCARKIFEK